MDNNKKKIMIGSAASVVLLLLIIVSVVFSKGHNNEVEVANNEEVNIDDVITDVANVSQGVSDTKEKDDNTVEVIPEPTTDVVLVDNTNAENTNTEVPDTENTKPVNEENEPYTPPTTTENKWGTPQEYHGDPEGRGPGRIIVKGFNYNDFAKGLTWRGDYWTASNGVELKIVKVEGRDTGMIPVPDGLGKDNEPTSPFQVAIAEALGEDLNDYAANLNVTIPLTSYKRSEIDINDADLVAYRDAYDYKLFANHGMADYYTPYEYGEQINLRFAVASDGIGEYDSVGAIIWEIYRVDDYWKVKMNCMPAEFRWDGIHQVLRYLSPDGDALYNVIYEDVYVGSPTILEYNDWFAVGNSQIYQEQTTGLGYMIYRFK